VEVAEVAVVVVEAARVEEEEDPVEVAEAAVVVVEAARVEE
jgi:hypothetical protein